MYSEVDIVNLALLRLGEEQIASLEENNKKARLGKAMFDIQRDLLLSKFAWNFANRTMLLAEVADIEHPVYQHVYGMPNDCLIPRRFVRMNDEGRYVTLRVHWEIWERHIVTNLSDAILLYTRRMTQPDVYGSQFAEALASILTAEMCPAITGDTKMYREYLQIASVKTAEAMADDANDDMIDPREDNDPRHDTFNYPDPDQVLKQNGYSSS